MERRRYRYPTEENALSLKNIATQIDREMCCNCGSTDGIEYHHVVPKIFGGRDIPSNIYPVCAKCHALVHFGKYGSISHSEATKIGLQKRRERGEKLGRREGTTVVTKKAVRAKEIITRESIDFCGKMADREVIKKIGNISRNSYYKYKKELKEDVEREYIHEKTREHPENLED